MTRSAIGFAALLLWSQAAALAQAAPPQTLPQNPVVAAPKLNLTLEQHHVIKEVIKDMKVTPSASSAASVGDPVPPDSALRPIPKEIASKVPQIKSHRFMVTAERILIVDPKDNKVADVIELN
ncbi:MAG TPA: DUF1236 domain-containing protein [Xanthobacteraceae bacterium]|jgi:hypothetical protein